MFNPSFTKRDALIVIALPLASGGLAWLSLYLNSDVLGLRPWLEPMGIFVLALAEVAPPRRSREALKGPTAWRSRRCSSSICSRWAAWCSPSGIRSHDAVTWIAGGCRRMPRIGCRAAILMHTRFRKTANGTGRGRSENSISVSRYPA